MNQLKADDARQLREEIERTRERLGATVEQLAAKVDVKSRAQAKAAELAGQLTWQARSVMAQAQKLAAQRPVRQAAAKGVGAARKHRIPLAAAGAAGMLAAIAFFIMGQRRKR